MIDIVKLHYRFLADGRQQGEAPQESIVWEMEQEIAIGLRRICGGLSAPIQQGKPVRVSKLSSEWPKQSRRGAPDSAVVTTRRSS
jgi:hypothetical protein